MLQTSLPKKVPKSVNESVRIHPLTFRSARTGVSHPSGSTPCFFYIFPVKGPPRSTNSASASRHPPTLRVRACRTPPFLKMLLSSFLSFSLSSFLPFFRTSYPLGGRFTSPLYPPPGHQLENLFRGRPSSEPTFPDANFRIHFR